MGRPLFVRTLTAAERMRLGSIVASKDFTGRIRAAIVLESSGGARVTKIASKLQLNKHTVRLWIKRFDGSGLDGLKASPWQAAIHHERIEGRDRQDRSDGSHEARAALHDVECLHAESASGERGRGGEDIGVLDEEDPRKKGVEHIRSKRWKTGDDRDCDEKVKRILELYNNPPDDGVVISLG